MSAVASGVRFTVAATLAAVAVAGVASLFVDGVERSAIMAGAGLGLLVQVVVFWVFGVLVFPTRRLVLVGVGMAVRMVVLLLTAFFAPLFGLPLAATLLTLVSVFVISTLLEPVVFQLETKSAS